MRKIWTVLFVFTPIIVFGGLRKYSVEKSPLSIDIEATEGFWDFSRQSSLADGVGAYGDLGSQIYYENTPDCCRAYTLRGDTLYFRGYNVGRNEHILADDYLPVVSMPLQVGRGFENDYSGKGLYCVNYHVVEQGEHLSQVVACGEAIISSGDTIGDVYLVREQFETRRNISDRIREFEADSVPLLRKEIYRWHRQGEISPLAIQIAEYKEDDNGEMMLSSERLFVCEDYEAEEQIQEADAEELTPSAIMQMLETAGATVGGGELTVSFGAISAAINVDIYLLDVSGNIYAHTARELMPEADNQTTIDVSAAPQGSYIVAVCYSQNADLNHKIAITL